MRVSVLQSCRLLNLTAGQTPHQEQRRQRSCGRGFRNSRGWRAGDRRLCGGACGICGRSRRQRWWLRRRHASGGRPWCFGCSWRLHEHKIRACVSLWCTAMPNKPCLAPSTAFVQAIITTSTRKALLAGNATFTATEQLPLPHNSLLCSGPRACLHSRKPCAHLRWRQPRGCASGGRRWRLRRRPGCRRACRASSICSCRLRHWRARCPWRLHAQGHKAWKHTAM